MVKAYQGELYKLPVAGQVAEGVLPVFWRGEKPESGEQQEPEDDLKSDEDPRPSESKKASSPSISQKMEEFGKRVEDFFAPTRSWRIAGYSAAIFWNIVLLIFFYFFHQYIAWYYVEPDGSVTRL